MQPMRMECDYLEGAHELVLNALCRTNGEQTHTGDPAMGGDALS